LRRVLSVIRRPRIAIEVAGCSLESSGSAPLSRPPRATFGVIQDSTVAHLGGEKQRRWAEEDMVHGRVEKTVSSYPAVVDQDTSRSNAAYIAVGPPRAVVGPPSAAGQGPQIGTGTKRAGRQHALSSRATKLRDAYPLLRLGHRRRRSSPSPPPAAHQGHAPCLPRFPTKAGGVATRLAGRGGAASCTTRPVPAARTGSVEEGGPRRRKNTGKGKPGRCYDPGRKSGYGRSMLPSTTWNRPAARVAAVRRDSRTKRPTRRPKDECT